MRCEHCGRIMRQGDSIHGIKYGTLTSTGFKAAQDSAVVIICEPCGTKAMEFVYSSLDTRALSYPTIFKMVTDLTSLMKNGYKLIQHIATLPAPEQKAILHLVNLGKGRR